MGGFPKHKASTKKSYQWEPRRAFWTKLWAITTPEKMPKRLSRMVGLMMSSPIFFQVSHFSIYLVNIHVPYLFHTETYRFPHIFSRCPHLFTKRIITYYKKSIYFQYVARFSIYFPYYPYIFHLEHGSWHGSLPNFAPGLGTPQRPIPSAAAGVEGGEIYTVWCIYIYRWLVVSNIFNFP